MQKTLFITGSTDGIGFVTAQKLVSAGHRVLVHGRSPAKLDAAIQKLTALAGEGSVDGVLADLSQLAAVPRLAAEVAARHPSLDVLINNAGVFATPTTRTPDGLDVRFAVNTLAPYLLTQRLLPHLATSGRIINVSSAAQAPVDLDALAGRVPLPDMAAYAQSKLALTSWSRHLAKSLDDDGPVVIAVNPGSMLGSKMVKEAFGVAGRDIDVGADILCRLALDDEFADASGRYFDNDAGSFGPPHAEALDEARSETLVQAIDAVLTRRIDPAD